MFKSILGKGSSDRSSVVSSSSKSHRHKDKSSKDKDRRRDKDDRDDDDARSTTTTGSSRRKSDHHHSSSSSHRRSTTRGDDRELDNRSTSTLSSSSHRRDRARDRDREREKERDRDRDSVARSGVSSYVTATSREPLDDEEEELAEEPLERVRSERSSRSRYEDEEETRSISRSERSERKRDRERDRDYEKSRDREERKKDRKEKDERDRDRDRKGKGREKERQRTRSGDDLIVDEPSSYSRSRAGFEDEISAPGFTQFPGQTANTFPGFPTAPMTQPPYSSAQTYHSPIMTQAPMPPVDPAPFGEAAAYYGDQGQSVAEQPGVRPQPPSVIVGAEPHLMAASAEPAPPVEPSAMGQVGSAAAFYADAPAADNLPSAGPSTSAEPARPPKPGGPSKPSKPSKPSVGSAVAAGAATYGIGSAMLGHGGANGGGHSSSSSSSHHHHSSDPGYSRPPKPNKHSTMPAVGMAAMGAGAGYAAAQASGMLHRPQTYSGAGLQPGSLAYHQQHHGPLRRFINFWKDPEAVGQFEEYTEYIGVCRYCFEPGSSPRDAPRKHHYKKRRLSGDRRVAGSRVDKLSRYASSEDERGRRKSNKKGWLAAGLAGYVGKSLFDKGREFDDSYSARSGHYRDYSDAGSSISRKSRTSRGTAKRSDISLSSIGIDDRGKGHKKSKYDSDRYTSASDSKVRKRRPKSRSVSRERSHSGLKTAAVGAAALGAASAMSSRRRSRSRSKSPRKYRRSRGRRSSTSSSSSGSYVDMSRSYKKPGASGFASFFSAPSERRVRQRPRKNKGFFAFSGSGSSSSDDADLAYGTGFLKSRSSQRKKSKERDDHAAILGLGATAATLAASASASHSRDKRRSPHSIYDRKLQRSDSRDKDEDDGWESATDESSSSVDSGLAYGMASSPNESMVSEPGTSKWGWRWGGKRKKSPKRQSSYNQYQQSGGVPPQPSYGATSTTSSLPSMHNVFPVPTQDPSTYDVARQSSMSSTPYSSQPQVPVATSRPQPVPLQHPQPIVPVSQAVYATEAYPAPSGPPVFAGPPNLDSTERRAGQQQNEYGIGNFPALRDLPEDKAEYGIGLPPIIKEDQSDRDGRRPRDSRRDGRRRRAESSPVAPITRSDSPKPAPLRRSATTREVQFDLTEEQADKERRQIEREEKREAKRREKEFRASAEKEDAWVRGRDEPKIDKYPEPVRDSSSVSWVAPVAVGAIGAAAAAAATSELDDSKDLKKHKDRREERRKERRGVSEKDEYTDRSDIAAPKEPEFDETIISPVKLRLARKAASRVKTSPVYENYADYFVPDEVRHGPRSPGSEASSEPPSPGYVVIESPSVTFAREMAPMFERSEKPRDDFPWPVPRLNLIEPTPPVSKAGSVLGEESQFFQAEPSSENRQVSVSEHDVSRDQDERERDAESAIVDQYVEYVDRPDLETKPAVTEPEVVGVPYSRESTTRQVDPTLPQEAQGHESPTHHMPGEFADDIEFAATLAAGASMAGFDPAVVIDDPSYRKRESPPGSETGGVNDTPLGGIVLDQITSPRPQPVPHGFVEEKEVSDEELNRETSRYSGAGEPAAEPEHTGEKDETETPPDEFQEKPAKLSKKEKRKMSKAAKRKSQDQERQAYVEEDDTPVERGPAEPVSREPLTEEPEEIRPSGEGSREQQAPGHDNQFADTSEETSRGDFGEGFVTKPTKAQKKAWRKSELYENLPDDEFVAPEESTAPAETPVHDSEETKKSRDEDYNAEEKFAMPGDFSAPETSRDAKVDNEFWDAEGDNNHDTAAEPPAEPEFQISKKAKRKAKKNRRQGIEEEEEGSSGPATAAEREASNDVTPPDDEFFAPVSSKKSKRKSKGKNDFFDPDKVPEVPAPDTEEQTRDVQAEGTAPATPEEDFESVSSKKSKRKSKDKKNKYFEPEEEGEAPPAAETGERDVQAEDSTVVDPAAEFEDVSSKKSKRKSKGKNKGLDLEETRESAAGEAVERETPPEDSTVVDPAAEFEDVSSKKSKRKSKGKNKGLDWEETRESAAGEAVERETPPEDSTPATPANEFEEFSSKKSKRKSKNKNKYFDFEDEGEAPTADVKATDRDVQAEESTPATPVGEFEEIGSKKLKRKSKNKNKSIDFEGGETVLPETAQHDIQTEENIPPTPAAEFEEVSSKKSKSKRRSKRDSDIFEPVADNENRSFDDKQSVVSSPANLDDSKSKQKSKDKKSGGFFGFFASKPAEESEPEESKHDSREVQSEVGADGLEDFKNKRKKRSSKSRGGGDDIWDEHEQNGKEEKSSIRVVEKSDEEDEWETSHRQKGLGRSRRRKNPYEDIVESGKGADLSDEDSKHAQSAENDEKPFLGMGPEMPSTRDSVSGLEGRPRSRSVRTATTAAAAAAAAIPTALLLQSQLRSRSTSPHSSEKSVRLPPYSRSRPTTPTDDQMMPRRLSIRGDPASNPLATASPTAVPLHFRRPKPSGSQQGSSANEPTGSPVSPSSGQRPGHKRPKSSDFRTGGEIRPLFLVERHASAKVDMPPDEILPSLPSSKTTSRASSVEDLKSAAENYSYIHQMHPLTEGPRQPIPFQIDTEKARHASDDILDSQQPTPTAASFQQTHKKGKPKYEFHSPSELLLDPALNKDFPGSPSTDPLPSPEGSVIVARDASAQEDLGQLPALPPSRPSSPALDSLPPLPESRPSSSYTESERQLSSDLADDAHIRRSIEQVDAGEKLSNAEEATANQPIIEDIPAGSDRELQAEEPQATQVSESVDFEPSIIFPQTLPEREAPSYISDSDHEKTGDELFHDAIENVSVASAENIDREATPVATATPAVQFHPEEAFHDASESVHPTPLETLGAEPRSPTTASGEAITEKAAEKQESTEPSHAADTVQDYAAVGLPDTSKGAEHTTTQDNNDRSLAGQAGPQESEPADFWSITSKKQKKGKKGKKKGGQPEPETSAVPELDPAPHPGAAEGGEAEPSKDAKNLEVLGTSEVTEEPSVSGPPELQEAEPESFWSVPSKKLKKGKKGKKKALQEDEPGTPTVAEAGLPEAPGTAGQDEGNIIDPVDKELSAEQAPKEEDTFEPVGEEAPALPESTPARSQKPEPDDIWPTTSKKSNKGKKNKKGKQTDFAETDAAPDPVVPEAAQLDDALDKRPAGEGEDEHAILEPLPSETAQPELDDFVPASSKSKKDRKNKKKARMLELTETIPAAAPKDEPGAPEETPAVSSETAPPASQQPDVDDIEGVSTKKTKKSKKGKKSQSQDDFTSPLEAETEALAGQLEPDVAVGDAPAVTEEVRPTEPSVDETVVTEAEITPQALEPSQVEHDDFELPTTKKSKKAKKDKRKGLLSDTTDTVGQDAAEATAKDVTTVVPEESTGEQSAKQAIADSGDEPSIALEQEPPLSQAQQVETDDFEATSSKKSKKAKRKEKKAKQQSLAADDNVPEVVADSGEPVAGSAHDVQQTGPMDDSSRRDEEKPVDSSVHDSHAPEALTSDTGDVAAVDLGTKLDDTGPVEDFEFPASRKKSKKGKKKRGEPIDLSTDKEPLEKEPTSEQPDVQHAEPSPKEEARDAAAPEQFTMPGGFDAFAALEEQPSPRSMSTAAPEATGDAQEAIESRTTSDKQGVGCPIETPSVDTSEAAVTSVPTEAVNEEAEDLWQLLPTKKGKKSKKAKRAAAQGETIDFGQRDSLEVPTTTGEAETAGKMEITGGEDVATRAEVPEPTMPDMPDTGKEMQVEGGDVGESGLGTSDIPLHEPGEAEPWTETPAKKSKKQSRKDKKKQKNFTVFEDEAVPNADAGVPETAEKLDEVVETKEFDDKLPAEVPEPPPQADVKALDSAPVIEAEEPTQDSAGQISPEPQAGTAADDIVPGTELEELKTEQPIAENEGQFEVPKPKKGKKGKKKRESVSWEDDTSTIQPQEPMESSQETNQQGEIADEPAPEFMTAKAKRKAKKDKKKQLSLDWTADVPATDETTPQEITESIAPETEMTEETPDVAIEAPEETDQAIVSRLEVDSQTPAVDPKEDGNEFQLSKSKKKKKNKKKLNIADWTDDVAPAQVEDEPAKSVPEESEQKLPSDQESPEALELDVIPQQDVVPVAEEDKAEALQEPQEPLQIEPLTAEGSRPMDASIPGPSGEEPRTINLSDEKPVESPPEQSHPTEEKANEESTAAGEPSTSVPEAVETTESKEEPGPEPGFWDFQTTKKGKKKNKKGRNIEDDIPAAPTESSNQPEEAFDKEPDAVVDPAPDTWGFPVKAKGKKKNRKAKEIGEDSAAGFSGPSSAPADQPSPTSREVNFETESDLWTTTTKKKGKKKNKKTLDYQENSSIAATTEISTNDLVETPSAPQPTDLETVKKVNEPEAEAEPDVWSLPPKKKGKKKNKQAQDTKEIESAIPPLSAEHNPVSEATPMQTVAEFPEADVEQAGEDTWEVPSKKGKKEGKKASDLEAEPTIPATPVDESKPERHPSEQSEDTGLEQHDILPVEERKENTETATDTWEVPSKMKGKKKGKKARDVEESVRDEPVARPEVPNTSLEALDEPAPATGSLSRTLSKKEKKAKKKAKNKATFDEEETGEPSLDDHKPKDILAADTQQEERNDIAFNDRNRVAPEEEQQQPESGPPQKRDFEQDAQRNVDDAKKQGQKLAELDIVIEDQLQNVGESENQENDEQLSHGETNVASVRWGTDKTSDDGGMVGPSQSEEKENIARSTTGDAEEGGLTGREATVESAEHEKEPGQDEEFPTIDWEEGKDEDKTNDSSLEPEAGEKVPSTSSLDLVHSGDERRIQDDKGEKYGWGSTERGLDTIEDFAEDARATIPIQPGTEAPDTAPADFWPVTSKKGKKGKKNKKEKASLSTEAEETTLTLKPEPSVYDAEPAQTESFGDDSHRTAETETPKPFEPDGTWATSGKKSKKSKKKGKKELQPDIFDEPSPVEAQIPDSSLSERPMEGQPRELEETGQRKSSGIVASVFPSLQRVSARRPSQEHEDPTAKERALAPTTRGLFGPTISQEAAERQPEEHSAATEESHLKSGSKKSRKRESDKELLSTDITDPVKKRVTLGSSRELESSSTDPFTEPGFSSGFESPRHEPPAVASISKKRSSDFRYDSPENRRHSSPYPGQASSPSPAERPRSLFGGPYGLAGDEGLTVSPPKTPLETIKEHVPTDSPAHSRSRELADVGSPERGTKSAKHTGSPRLSMGPEYTLPQPKRTRPPKLSESLLSAHDDDDNIKSERRAVSGPQGENTSIEKKDVTRSLSMGSIRSSPSSPGLRRIDSSRSGDLRAASRRDRGNGKNKTPAQSHDEESIEAIPSSSSYDPVTDKGKRPVRGMADVYEGWGDVPGSPRSPSRPPSVRRRRSVQHLQDLESRVDQLVSENRLLAASKATAEQKLENQSLAQRQAERAIEARDQSIRDKDLEIQQLKNSLEWLQKEVARLSEVNEGLTATNASSIATREQESREYEQAKQLLQESEDNRRDLQEQHGQLSAGLDGIIAHHVGNALAEKDAELQLLREELEAAKEKVKELQAQIIASSHDDVVTFRDEDYFDGACQKLCQHVQQWVLRFSKFSDMRLCRLTSSLRDEKIALRFENAILDGSDVDTYLSDRVKRRDVFMSVVMTMVWEYIFTRYLFGMDREQRQKLKTLEKQLADVGPPNAVHRWRATTLSLLAKRPAFREQRANDTEAVVQEIYLTLSRLLPPPHDLEQTILDSLRKVMRAAVDLSIEMRTQRAEYIMLPPLQPEYDSNGELARKVHFNAALMNERSGETTSNEELEEQQAVVRMVLFPLVVKKGSDEGEGDEEIVVCPAQVLVARPGKDKKVVRVLSGEPMSIDQGSRSIRSHPSINMEMGNVM